MRCKKCGGITRSPTKITKETLMCGFCRGTYHVPLRRPRVPGGQPDTGYDEM